MEHAGLLADLSRAAAHAGRGAVHLRQHSGGALRVDASRRAGDAADAARPSPHPRAQGAEDLEGHGADPTLQAGMGGGGVRVS